ncbi:hypothetical protein B0H19DRAFT_1121284 [Mycena capillaripes]|nr:hypothetical protein B0H19DRAFT_1121284 [Mycena capillaripes]
MSQTPGFGVSSPTLYRYIVIGALSVVVIIGGLLYWHSRVMRRHMPTPIQRPGNVLRKKPRLYDAYLDGHGELWHDIMPLSMHRVAPFPRSSAKHVSLDVDPLVSALSTVALIIAMPYAGFPTPAPNSRLGTESLPNSDPESEEALPHLEFGVADVEVPGE